MLSAAVIVAGLAILFFVVRTVQQYYRLRQFGGPWSSGVSRLWLLRANASNEMNVRFTRVNDKHGSTARIAPNMLITCDPELVKRMNSVRSSFRRSEWYTALRLHPTRDNVVSVVDERIHTSIRNRMAPGYSGKENLHMEDDIDAQLLKFLDLVDREYISTESDYKPMDISETTSFFTLDVISTIAFGKSFGFLDLNRDPFGYLANLQEFLPAIMLFGAYTELQKILRIPIFKAIMPKSTDKRGLGRVMGFAKDRVAERFGDKPVVRKDMLGSFISRGLSQEELESETLTQITAGSDSTASSLRMTLHYITTTPHIQARLLSEVRRGIVAGRISRPVIKDTEARQLPYLQACIKEGLRMYPPVTGLLAKQVPKDGAYIDNKFAPPGTWIAWNSYGMQRNKHIFGPDAYIFRPERWLPRDDSPAETKRLEVMTETVGLVFGYGRYGCLGKGVAMMELNKAIIETLLRFEMQPVSLARPFVERCVGFFLHTDMLFRVTRRVEEDVNGHVGEEDKVAVQSLSTEIEVALDGEER